jgi:hypothetical protein
MKPELEAAVIEIMKDALKLKDFVKGEIPEVVSQLLLYKTVFFSIGASVGLVLIIIASVIWYRAWKGMLRTECPILIATICSVIGIPVFVSFSERLLLITIAPKIWLIEYIAYLTN